MWGEIKIIIEVLVQEECAMKLIVEAITELCQVFVCINKSFTTVTFGYNLANPDSATWWSKLVKFKIHRRIRIATVLDQKTIMQKATVEWHSKT